MTTFPESVIPQMLSVFLLWNLLTLVQFGMVLRHLDTLNLLAMNGEDRMQWRASFGISSHGYNRYYLNGMTRRPAVLRSWAKLPLGARQ